MYDDDDGFDNSDETTQDYNVAVDAAARRSHNPANWNYEDGTPESGPPLQREKPDYPCDHGPCPFLNGGNSAETYFCRNNCGMGVDEN